MVEWTVKNMMKICLQGVDKEKLKCGNEKELEKFRANLNKFVLSILKETGAKMDAVGANLGAKMDTLNTKMDEMLSLQKKTLKILDERLPKPSG